MTRNEFTGREKRTIGERLVRERTQRLLNLEEMGALIGLSKVALSQIERGQARLAVPVMRKLLAFNPELLKGIVHPDVLKKRDKSKETALGIQGGTDA